MWIIILLAGAGVFFGSYLWVMLLGYVWLAALGVVVVPGRWFGWDRKSSLCPES